ncbi:SDR family NAD(P)-dependent oxidoreductase [Fodinicola acaciae]|uniref:SDR family NAD(P)-dependent oxidoreductase n=1 Tax=Fodinicola acaciae TaxID=2681555 RepID=UPI0013CFF13D|nr:SDR family oxidoreductase [Fodinicola acaciae]
MDIAGKVALVTGAAVGSGRAIAERLAAEGARLALADIDADGCAETRRRIGRGELIRVDLRDDAEVERMIASTKEKLGGLDILVNNAGGGQPAARFPEATVAQWSDVLAVNLRAPMLATQLALPSLRSGGVVVNIASTAGIGHTPYRWPEYAAAKAGLIRFTSTLTDLPGVRVNCLVPDWIRTERAEAELAAMSHGQRSLAPPPIPLDVLTDAVIELVSDDSLSGRVMVLRPGRSPELLGAG